MQSHCHRDWPNRDSPQPKWLPQQGIPWMAPDPLQTRQQNRSVDPMQIRWMFLQLALSLTFWVWLAILLRPQDVGREPLKYGSLRCGRAIVLPQQ